jgi:glutamine synthetase
VAAGTDPGEARTGDAYQQTARPFPQHLGLAADAFLASPFVTEAFGAAVAEQYGLTAQYEWTRFLDAVTDWELDRYFEVI